MKYSCTLLLSVILTANGAFAEPEKSYNEKPKRSGLLRGLSTDEKRFTDRRVIEYEGRIESGGIDTGAHRSDIDEIDARRGFDRPKGRFAGREELEDRYSEDDSSESESHPDTARLPKEVSGRRDSPPTSFPSSRGFVSTEGGPASQQNGAASSQSDSEGARRSTTPDIVLDPVIVDVPGPSESQAPGNQNAVAPNDADIAGNPGEGMTEREHEMARWMSRQHRSGRTAGNPVREPVYVNPGTPNNDDAQAPRGERIQGQLRWDPRVNPDIENDRSGERPNRRAAQGLLNQLLDGPGPGKNPGPRD